MKFLVTGHTGFKGSWLILLLHELGHEVEGIALNPEAGSLYERAKLSDLVSEDYRIDIRNHDLVSKAVLQSSPDVLIHLAAQPLVNESYVAPHYTFTTNVIGTLNVLSASQDVPTIKRRVIVTSDKVYSNDGRTTGYKESDPLGGRDPYSASKAMADILSQSWIHSFAGPPTFIGRAGNVVGGGDISENRLIPDLVRAFRGNNPLELRYPGATRPWQHVLDCLNGYISLIQALDSQEPQISWNIGPNQGSVRTVRDVVRSFSDALQIDVDAIVSGDIHNHEEAKLTLDSSSLEASTSWTNKLSFDQTIKWTAEWERKVLSGKSPRKVSIDQTKRFMDL